MMEIVTLLSSPVREPPFYPNIPWNIIQKLRAGIWGCIYNKAKLYLQVNFQGEFPIYHLMLLCDWMCI